MALKDELGTYVQKVLDDQWTRRKGQKVPDPDDLPLSNVAVELDATVLYADLAASTKMTKGYKDWFAAEVYKNYLYCASKIIRARGGSITAYDGDRVMGVFIGDRKNSEAAKCALQINWACREIVQAKLEKKYDTDFELKQRVGIDTSQLFVARTGIRGSNDLVWVGNASNNAAKMAALPTAYPSYITVDVYERLADWAKIGSDGRNMWTDLGTRDLGYKIYGSTWWCSL
ncbi:adenylate/guanylate cyclase domain-containing protein [Nocardioides sambongensis]|uniref:adenylate/guanylate cyclase domain-containing protein n=1 Tax=Nocardioides sambongensis TaxID=2589074 RepID=UPI00112B897C|nr:adenylate/guanylate cyclase domain-containing protein [Nocardioides sambongensis]